MTKRATPNQIMDYKSSILLHKIYNSNIWSNDLADLFFSQNFNNRSQFATFVDTSRYKVGKNVLSNRFSTISNKISYEWLNLEINPFKIKCKGLFLNPTW